MVAVCAAAIYFGVVFSKPIVRATPAPSAKGTPTPLPSVVVPMPSVSIRSEPFTPLPDVSQIRRVETSPPQTATPGVIAPKPPVPPVAPRPP